MKGVVEFTYHDSRSVLIDFTRGIRVTIFQKNRTADDTDAADVTDPTQA